MTLDITQLSPHVGASIRLKPEQLEQPAVRTALQDAFVRYGVLLFPGFGTSPERHVALSRCFGELQIHPVNTNQIPGFPEVVDMSYTPPTRPGDLSYHAVYEIEGRALAGWLPWHFDLSYMPAINRGSMLRALKVPPDGGRTGFLDRIRLYELLPDDLKQAIEGRRAIYRFQPDMMARRFCRPADMKLLAPSSKADRFDGETLDRDFPPVSHPLVYSQSETGRKVLNLAPMFAAGIEDMDAAEGDALLDRLIAHCTTGEYAYFHRWRENDLLIWDNWRALHSAEGVPPQYARRMQRTSLKGDYGLGRVAGMQSGAVTT
jgi:taurine dioxygenase